MQSPSPSLRIASFQRRPLFDDVDGIVQRLQADLAWCDAQGVQLAVFPECYLQGYASDRETVMRRALELDGEALATILRRLAPFKTMLVLGLSELRRADSAAALYNTAAVIHQGRLIGHYAKTHPNEAAFSAGEAYPIFELESRRFGINICNDANFAVPALRLSGQGAGLLCYPLNNMLLPATADKWRGQSVDNLRQRALDTGCWVISSDVVGEYAGKMSYGCTCIVNPAGDIVRQAAEGEEAVVLCDLP
ncbi:carbon-nitrogen hydrolase family protein [Undibacterium terreum]|uniref:CN hydrolase domain-containing protein n=1 Tax=Undibacterium terreum TaxID=1224302 RepID=A0A916XCX0_9BURK|nr:carbon-nitrogen hydrolase family protein [Undibacterium terreum]GGC64385.1 hypothetical protein GCM10011396_09190 [Undibacterium terreum]